MHLKSLSINGFKSFAKKSELEFTTSITAIVGPNGSGKSNVAEAFRFVLGEQSIKSLRGKKGEDLIFNGSESVSRSNRASVSITLQNYERSGVRAFPVDFDELIIERVVHRDGINEYLLNGGKTRLKDIQELLAAANIGSTGHHIISQGEADRILSANPRERREMIEDALGLKVYQFKKTESERKLKKTRENILQVESLRREVAPHLKFLERQVKKLERSRELQQELKEQYANYLKREDIYIAYYQDMLKERIHVPKKRKNEIESKLKVAREMLAEKVHDETSEKLISLEKEMRSIRTEREQIARSMGVLEGQMFYLERRIREAKEKRTTDTTSSIPYEDLKSAVTFIEKSADRAILHGEPKALIRLISEIREVLDTLMKKALHHEEVPTIEAEVAELEVLLSRKNEFDEKSSTLTLKENALNVEYQAMKASIEMEASESREAEREVFMLMNELGIAEREIEKIVREQEMIERDRTQFKEELQEAVSLIGRGAALYFNYTVIGEDGTSLSTEEIVSEERVCQYERRRELEKMKIRLEELGTGTGEDIIKEYKDAKERDSFLMRELDDLNESARKLEALIGELTEDLNEQFINGIDKIGVEFKRFFVLMFNGGTAKLLRTKPKARKKDDEEYGAEEDEEEIDAETEEGIEIDVKLPNKRVRGLDMLSGGERALTSIALIFAMSQVNPPLFVILDETDAALDEANSRRYGDMITALSERSQLILITHNRETMGRAGVLYGVTMAGDGVSKLLSVKFEDALSVAK